MNKRNILLKIICLILSISLLISFFVPIILNAASIDTAKKEVLKTIADIQNIDENKYPGYKEKLEALKKVHPNWTFTLYYTGIHWDTAVYNEAEGLHSRSLVQGKNGEWLCSSCGTKVYDAGGWMCASKKAVAHLMDPRNYLSDNYIFQFERLSYDASTYTIEGIEKILNGTFMAQKTIREYYHNENFEDITFAEAIMEAATSSGVSPYHLAARIRQEVGVNGSNSIFGTYKGYEGYYNFYNIGANSGTDPIGNGLKYASSTNVGKYLLPWTDPVKAIKGGAIWIATNYIAVGQDTLYFQKFDVVSNGTAFYNHQYMQNIFAAKNEGNTTYNAYNKLGLINNNYNFIIPLYEGMPRTLSPEPSNASNHVTIELNEKVKINATNVSLRSKPTTSSTRLSVLAKNTELTRLQKNVANANGYAWDKVKLSNGTIGYVANKYLSTVTTSSNTTNNTTTTTTVIKTATAKVNVRSKASTKGSKVATIAKGTKVTILQENAAKANGYTWDKVKLSNGKTGYIANKYLSKASSGTSNSNSSSTTATKKATTKVNVRSKATTSGSKVATIAKGTKVTILQSKVAYKNGYYWDKVKLSNGKTGYIASKYLK